MTAEHLTSREDDASITVSRTVKADQPQAYRAFANLQNRQQNAAGSQESSGLLIIDTKEEDGASCTEVLLSQRPAVDDSSGLESLPEVTEVDQTQVYANQEDLALPEAEENKPMSSNVGQAPSAVLDACPENISEEEEGELGLGELLEEHHALYFADKLSNNFSSRSNEQLQVSQGKPEAAEAPKLPGSVNPAAID